VDAVRHALDAQHTLVLERIETCHEPFHEPDRAILHCHT